jgi:hypothetical protein
LQEENNIWNLPMALMAVILNLNNFRRRSSYCKKKIRMSIEELE